MSRRVRAAVCATFTAASVAVAGCHGGKGAPSAPAAPPAGPIAPAAPAASSPRAGFDASAIYRREAPGVVTVISVSAGVGVGVGGGGGQGSGFAISTSGEIVTNAHVVTDRGARGLRRAGEVYVQFSDGNQVPARIVGVDPDADVALLRVEPRGLHIDPLPLGTSTGLVVGTPVAAIGSPFGEPQSLSVGVISALDRSIESLTRFSISGAIQTDAAVNRGNSGGPLVDARGRVVGINSQIRSTGGGGEGVGFAVPIDVVERSLAQLRARGRVAYAFLGVRTAPVYPQLRSRFNLGVDHGAWLQEVTPGGPAARAGLRGGDRAAAFQAQTYRVGGDVIAKVAGRPLRAEDDLSREVARHEPGQTLVLEIYREGKPRTVRVRLGARPSTRVAAAPR